MRALMDKTLKPVLLIGGLGTAAAGVDAFFPRYAVENVQNIDYVPEYAIFVQHWGMMVGLMGVFMIAAVFKRSWRTPILLYSLIEKGFMVYLVATNLGEDFASGFRLPAAMDAVIVLWSIAYFATRGVKVKAA